MPDPLCRRGIVRPHHRHGRAIVVEGLMFEILEHTADIGFRVRAETLEELFQESARALVSVVLDPEDIEPRETRPVAASGEDRDSLLVNWLNEVLYYLDGARIALRDFHVESLAETRIAARASGEPIDPSRHRMKLIVKGVTYHQLRIWRDRGMWSAEVFLDI